MTEMMVTLDRAGVDAVGRGCDAELVGRLVAIDQRLAQVEARGVLSLREDDKRKVEDLWRRLGAMESKIDRHEQMLRPLHGLLEGLAGESLFSVVRSLRQMDDILQDQIRRLSSELARELAALKDESSKRCVRPRVRSKTTPTKASRSTSTISAKRKTRVRKT